LPLLKLSNGISHIDMGGDPGPGNRVRIIGYASELFEPGERDSAYSV